ncbi:phage portal protein [Nocardia cyriacigeorgica]|uniref:phage portal protein n=1 Tax=Nocardia cyriacigeorgica TaxID=135487 RepID=UPI0018931979|nr:phage portal protein [Nocardia cyriacigeorgica]MBF6085211.1 phage portal protein [Nocardia cyriacigeorgica]
MAEQEGVQWTPEQWFEHCMNKFDAELPTEPRTTTANTPRTRRERLDLLWSYYVGDPPLPTVGEQYRTTFQEVMRKARSNYATMAVDVMTDRSIVLGVSTEADKDVDGDDIARQIADESGFAAVQRDLQTYLFVLGEAYALVVPPAEGVPDARPMILAEDPRWAVGQRDPLNPRRLLAFVKVFNDELMDQQVALLFVDGQKYTWRRTPGNYSTSFAIREWDLTDTEAVPGLETLGGVPAVRFDNKLGLGEFEPHIDLLDRIMDGVFQRIVIGWYQSFRQRAVKGDLDGGHDLTEEPTSDNFIRTVADGELVDLFQADPGALWLVPEGVDFWESQQADLGPLINAIRDDVKEFAAATRTPLHVITPDAANQTAEGASLMREALVDKVNDRQARQTAPWTLVWQIAFAMAAEETRTVGVKLLWAKVDRSSLQAKADAIAKTTGVLSRKRQLISIMEMSPEEAKLNESELIQEQMTLDTSFSAPTATATAGTRSSPSGSAAAASADPAEQAAA